MIFSLAITSPAQNTPVLRYAGDEYGLMGKSLNRNAEISQLTTGK
jgi:hypothetical protein